MLPERSCVPKYSYGNVIDDRGSICTVILSVDMHYNGSCLKTPLWEILYQRNLYHETANNVVAGSGTGAVGWWKNVFIKHRILLMGASRMLETDLKRGFPPRSHRLK